MNVEKTASKISYALDKWLGEAEGKLIVGIDGYSGTGKTTIAQAISKSRSDALVVSFDDFLLPRRRRERLVKEATNKPKVVELHWYNVSAVLKLFKLFKKGKSGVVSIPAFNPQSGRYDKKKNFDLRKKVLIVEGVFLYHPKLFKNVWNKKIFLLADRKQAALRRVAREKERWKDEYISERHPDSWIRLFKIAYNNYTANFKPQTQADLLIKV